MTDKDRVNKFKNEKIAVNCETEEESKSFVEWLFDNGMKWTYHTKDTTFFDNYKNETCYVFDFSGGDKHLEYSSKQLYKEEGWNVIKYNDFMKEDKMTNLEYVISKGLTDEGSMLCNTAHICKYGVECGVKECLKCEFNNDVNLCVQTLLQEHKEPIKLKQWEHDLLKVKHVSYGNHRFNWYLDLCSMKEKGYFKGITDTSMTLREILDNCEVVE